MALDFDPAGDLVGVADGLEQVTVHRPGNSQPATVEHALRRALGTRELEASAGRYTASDVVWHLPGGELEQSPRLGDVIVDGDGHRWTVLDVRRTSGDPRWRCVGRNLAIVHGLDRFVDVQKATFAKGDAGAETPTWKTWKTGLRAKIQPVEMEVRDEHGRVLAHSRYKVYLAEDLALDHTHRIQGPDGTVYTVTGSRRAERIDALMEVDVVRTT
jgi:hypothetical protein